MSASPRVCVIGAGSSGIASCRALQARGIEFDCFEKGSHIGGNWKIGNDNGQSAAYRSLFMISSRRMSEYAAFPMPDEYPDYPHHSQMAAYFDAYADHFGLREQISFRAEVTSVERAEGGGWDVTRRAADGEEQTDRYEAVMVANGHHWNPRWPEPAFEGEFDGEAIHAHEYHSAEGYEDKNVLVVGLGNSACDIAVETSRVSHMTYLAVRTGAWVIPKYLGAKPIDATIPDWAMRWLPTPLLLRISGKLLALLQGKPQDYGLPKPDHRLGRTHPTVSSDLLTRLGHGRIKPKPNIQRLEGGSVRFEDGSVEQIDKIVYCTGYKVTFPFFAPELLDPSEDNRVDLYRRVVHPDLEGLYFIGLLQPQGSLISLAELQTEWVADILQGTVELPAGAAMEREIARDQRAKGKRFVASKRHTLEVDYQGYKQELQRERRRRRVRGVAGDVAKEARSRVTAAPAG